MSERLKDFVRSRTFEMVSGIVVMLCVGLECLKIQNESLTTAKILGVQEADVSWKGVLPVFGVLEHMANVFFTIELLLRLGRRLPGVVPPLLQRWRVHHSHDPLVLTYFSWLFKGLNGESPAFTRMARMLLFVKFACAFRTTRMFLEVRVLTLTLVSSVMALFWSMVC